MSDEKNLHPFLVGLSKFFKTLDEIILIVVSFGIVIVTAYQLWDVFDDLFLEEESHAIPYLINELMFVLIGMELFRQVIRQVNYQPFSLNPLLFIGVIASVRGMLITQMNLASGGIDVRNGIAILLAYSFVMLILVLGYFINAKIQGIPVTLFKKKKENE